MTQEERIEKAAEEYFNQRNCPFGLKDLETFHYAVKWALQNQWISVEEALPPRSHFLDGKETVKSIYVFVRYKNGAFTSAWYCYSTKVWYFAVGRKGENSINGEITHWMPIPELKGGE